MENNSNFFERILQIIDYYGIKSINSFAKDYLQYTSSEKINRLKKENSNPSYDILLDISNKFEDINTNWLLTGNGRMLKDEYGYAIEQETNTVCENTSEYKKKEGIPLIPINAMAGYMKGEIQVLEYECERYVIPAFKEADFLIPIKGDSMYPKYSSGDIVACKKLSLNDLFFQWNKVYVVDTTQGALIKRICQGSDAEHVLICSDNDNYSPFELHRSQINNIALVVGVIRLE